VSGGRLYEVLERAAEQRPRAPAFTFLDSRLRPSAYTYQDLFERVAEVGQRLAKADIDDTAPLGILVRSQEDQTLHYLAALRAGLLPAILTPPNRKLNRAYYVETMAAVLARCRFSALVTDVDLHEVTTPTLRPFTFERQGAGPADGHVPGSAAVPPNASFLQFSSGTTGIKRGVLVRDEAVLSQLDIYSSALGLSPDDVILTWLPLYHDMGFIACLNLPLAFGIHAVVIDPIDWVSDPSLFVRAASRYQATLAWNPNFAFAFMAQRTRDSALEGADLSRFRGLVNCSEPVTFESQRQFRDRFSRYGLQADVFWGCYAMAETTFALTHGTPNDPDYLDDRGPDDDVSLPGRLQVSVGRPLATVLLSVRSDRGDELPDRTVGELWVKSPFTFSAYYNDPAATKEAFSDGWYRTGDLGYRVREAFYVIGRKKDLIIVAGVNIFPQDVEDLVSGMKGVLPGRVAAFSDFDSSLQTEKVTVLAESALDGPAARNAVIATRQRLLASFQLANFDVHLVPPGWLVKASSGKMARGANRRKWSLERGS
jgi:acyl-CoA synthetase (AMP-forming)/AMP-acid ligase II